MIECNMLDGRIKQVEVEKLQFRPAAYAIIADQGRILLLKTRTTGRYALPGGGIEKGETIAQGLRREVIEETGIEIEIEEQIFFAEEFFYYEPTDEAFQSYRFVYHCKPRSLALAKDHEVDDDEVVEPRWIEIDGLKADQFQDMGHKIMDHLQPMDGKPVLGNNSEGIS